MILVLVVMIVMGLVTASILTFSLRNLQNQQLSIERMADKYAAQGEMEKNIAEFFAGNRIDSLEAFELSNEDRTLTITLTVEQDSATVTCTLIVDSTEVITVNQHETVDGVKQTAFTTTGNTKWEYDSYKITYSNGETEEEVPAT